MLIIQGAQDGIVPASQSLALQQRLQQQGIGVQYISYKGDHGFQGLDQQQKDAISAQVNAYLIAQEHP